MGSLIALDYRAITRRCLVLTLLCLLCFVWRSEAEQFRFDSWTVDRELPSNWTLGIQQTPDGYLWIISRGALLRFDGLRFQPFNRVNTPAIHSTSFASFGLTLDREGGLWAATWQAGAIRYFHGVFTSYTERDGLPNNRVVRIDQDEDGNVWIFTDPGLSVWKKGKITRIAPGNPSFDKYLLAPPNLGIDPYLLGLWRCTAAGWERFAFGRWQSVPLPAPPSQLGRIQLDMLTEDVDHRLWFKIIGRDRDIYSVQNGRLLTFRGVPKGSFACYQDRVGRLWITDHQGHTGLWQKGVFTAFDGLSTTAAFRVFEDRDRQFWVGTLHQGLFRLAAENITVMQLPGGAAVNRIGSVTQDKNGDIWVGSRGVSRFHEHSWQTFLRGHAAEKSFDAQVTDSIFLQPDGTLLAGYLDELVLWKQGRFRPIPLSLASIKHRINTMIRDCHGDLWLGGAALYRLHNSQLVKYAAKDGLLAGDVRVLLDDPERGSLWIASDEGLSLLKDGRFQSWTERDGLSSNHLLALYRDAQNVLWIGTADGGLNRFANGSFRSINSDAGLSSDDIYQIFEDKFGFLWFTSRRGISRVAKQQLNDFAAGALTRVHALRLSKADGLRSIDCRGHGQPAGFQRPDGTLLFPTEDGLAVLDPAKVVADSQPPPVRIETCLLGRQALDCNRELRLPPAPGELEIQYTAVNLRRPEQTRFRYQLAGLDTHWLDAGTRRSAVFAQLPPGRYVFKVMAASSDGVWGDAASSLYIRVLPHFYQTWWFLCLLLALSAAAIWSAHRFRIAQLRQSQRAQDVFSRQLLSAQESERRRIAAELHDSLGQSLVLIRAWAQMGSDQLNTSPSAREELGEISAIAGKALDDVREIAYNLGPFHLERIGLANTLRDMARKIKQASGIPVTTELDDLAGSLPRDAEMNLFRIAQEALNNIVKYSQATEARILLKNEPQRVRLTISDNGIGFEPQGQSSAAAETKGFGLAGIAERVRLLHGSYTIRCAPGQGTVIDVSLAKNTT